MPRKKKELPKARRFTDHFLKSAAYLPTWNNSTNSHVRFFKAVSLFTVNLYNVRFSDLNITEFKQSSTRTDKIYVVLLIGLSIHGKMSKTKAIEIFNLSYKSANIIINQYLEHGYLKAVATQRRHLYNGNSIMVQVEEIELTSKGYDLLNHIFSILIDDSFL